jgi:hypothetical protein
VTSVMSGKLAPVDLGLTHLHEMQPVLVRVIIIQFGISTCLDV